MKILIFINDSYFSYLLSQPFLDRYHKSVALAVFSTRIQSSIGRLLQIYKKSSASYFLYRSSIQGISKIVGAVAEKSARAKVNEYAISNIDLENVNQGIDGIRDHAPFDLGVAFNFDQIIDENVQGLCKHGVLNIHASKLPQDKGISPVLWAFARGDEEIWTTIYKMDRKIDAGPIVEQFSTPVHPGDTAFSLYRRVCTKAGQRLVSIIEKLETEGLEFQEQEPTGVEKQWSWPNKEQKEMMRSNHRRYIKFSDLLDLARDDSLS